MEYSEVKELIGIFEKTDLNDMEVRLGNDSLRLNRGKAPVLPPMPAMPAMPAMQTLANAMPGVVTEVLQGEQTEAGNMVSPVKTSETAETAVEQNSGKKGGKLITAPIVGTFYQSQGPGQEPFVKVGAQVSVGDVVCIIEAMKFMNEVKSEVSGTITEILAEDGAFVEYGQELFRVE